MEWAEGHKISFHPVISRRSANISFKQKGGWFEVEGDVEISGGQVVSLRKLLEMMRQSSKQKFLRIGDNEYITLSNQIARILKRLDTVTSENRSHLQMAPAAMQLQAHRKVILTGTPIQNHLAELWNLFQFINPGLLGSAKQFRQKFIQLIEGDHDKERQSQLRRLISPFLLRRTKSEVIGELPEKNEIHLPVELSSDEMTMYEVRRRKAEAAVRADKSLNVSTLAEITRLRQIACSRSLIDNNWKVPSSKTLVFIDLAESLNDSGNRALVFSQFTSFLDEVRKAMEKAKLPYLYLDGSTPIAKREQLVKDFQPGECPFFLIRLKAGEPDGCQLR